MSNKKEEKEKKIEDRKVYSSVGINYTTKRNLKFISGLEWLDGKRKDDDIGELWRIHDGLYDLQNFIKKHPGGSDWIRLTKGTDITEAFETHHIKGVAEQLLSRFYIKEASKPRISPFTFNEDGFYRTLKSRVAKELPKLPKHLIQQSKLFADIVTSLYLLFCVLATYSHCFSLGIIAGFLLTMTVNTSHNFVHQRDNFRMYYLDLTMFSSRDFRITHALSHHLFPNTIHDLEISIFEPMIYFLPEKKSNSQKYFCWLYAILVFFFLSPMGYFSSVTNVRTLCLRSVIPWLPLVLTFAITGQSFVMCLVMFLWIVIWGSLFFGIIGKTAAHHHPEIFHDGDTPRPKEERDFGIHQLDAVADRPNINGSPLLILTNFGDHALHHLFPTLDHGVLDSLYPIFLKTCIEFGVEWKLYSSVELVKGMLQQLVREKSNKLPPPPLKKNILLS